MSTPCLPHEALSRWLAARGDHRRRAFAELIASLKDVVERGEDEEAVDVLRGAALPTLSYTEAQALARVHTVLRRNGGARSGPSCRLAVLGSFTLDQWIPLAELYLLAAGVHVQTYRAAFGTFRQDILDPQSALYAFRPDIAYLPATWRDLAHHPQLGDDEAAVEERVASEVEDWAVLWENLRRRLACLVVQDNFALPPWRLLGNHERRVAGSPGSYGAAVNDALVRAAPPHVTIHDVEYLAATVGRRTWCDDRFYHYAKMPCAPEHLVTYAHSVASVVAALRGQSRKCLVLDLDGTLWGGIIGDDGIEGIRLGQGDPEGEAFIAFQRYVKGLESRGIVLAVCSKNEDAAAREPFEEHPEMHLRLDDISCFVANWADKATNLRRIARELGLGLDSLVFADDNPVERALVRQLAPEVLVPELPGDPSDYIRALDEYRCFQVVSLVDEDLRRTRLYQANAERRGAHAQAASVDEFLRSLDMVARVEPIQPVTLQRCVQLIGRSNQFNLTTRRHSAAEVMAMLAADDWVTRTISLSDRFGDNGLISVLLARVDGPVLAIDTWLMSCRVLKRTVEHFCLNHLCALARGRGIHTILGEYIPTAKNALVRDHYAQLGFAQTQSEPDGHTWWELDLSDARRPLTTHVKEYPGDG